MLAQSFTEFWKSSSWMTVRVIASKAAQMSLTFNATANWFTWISPRLALRTMRRRETKKAAAFTL
jgi:hypothetical protein